MLLNLVGASLVLGLVLMGGGWELLFLREMTGVVLLKDGVGGRLLYENWVRMREGGRCSLHTFEIGIMIMRQVSNVDTL